MTGSPHPHLSLPLWKWTFYLFTPNDLVLFIFPPRNASAVTLKKVCLEECLKRRNASPLASQLRAQIFRQQWKNKHPSAATTRQNTLWSCNRIYEHLRRRCLNKSHWNCTMRLLRLQQKPLGATATGNIIAVFLFSTFRFDRCGFWMREDFPGFSTWGCQRSPALVPTPNSATHQLFSAVKSSRPSCHCLVGTHSQLLFLVLLPAAACHLTPPPYPPPWAPDTGVDFPVGLAMLGKVRMCSSCFRFPSCSAS